MNDRKQYKTSLFGAVLAGGLASACCLGPFLLMALGVGSASFFTVLTPYRPLFATITIALIAWSVWQHRQRKKACLTGDCAAKNSAWLWIFGSLALLLLISPTLLSYLIPTA